MALNRWQGIGNLGSDPEVNYLPSGDAVVNISLACNEKWKDKNGEAQERTEWIRCVAFGRRAEVLRQYCRKGSKLFAEGRLRTRKWQDKEGNDKYSTEIVLSGFQFLHSKSGNGSGRAEAQGSYPEAARAPRENSAPSSDIDLDDEIPF